MGHTLVGVGETGRRPCWLRPVLRGPCRVSARFPFCIGSPETSVRSIRLPVLRLLDRLRGDPLGGGFPRRPHRSSAIDGRRTTGILRRDRPERDRERPCELHALGRSDRYRGGNVPGARRRHVRPTLWRFAKPRLGILQAGYPMGYFAGTILSGAHGIGHWKLACAFLHERRPHPAHRGNGVPVCDRAEMERGGNRRGAGLGLAALLRAQHLDRGGGAVLA